MDKLITFYPAFEIDSRSTDTIFRELCQPADYKKLNEGGWKEALVNRYGELMAAAPNIRRLAARLINEGLAAKGYAGVDAERVYFNTFTDGYKNSGDQFYSHNPDQLNESYSLVDTAIFDIFTRDWYHKWGDLANDYICGIYSEGKDADKWGPSNKLPFSCQVVADILYYDKSIFNAYPNEIYSFWNQYAEAYRDFLADSFLASALVQYRARLLSDECFGMIRNFYYSKYQGNCKVILLDVYGYHSSDILCIDLGTQRQVLYIPGANMPFREFVSTSEMKAWIAQQLRMPEWRNAFARHFSLYDRSDGGTYYGVDSALRFMAEGNSQWDPQRYIIYNEHTYDLTQDVFAAIRDHIKIRTEQDAGQNPGVDNDRFRDYVMEFEEFFLAQAQMPTLILPESPNPFRMDESHSPLGLLSSPPVDPHKLSERYKATGSRVGTDAFKGLELLWVCTLMADELKTYSRPASQIPAFGSETQAITARFGLTQAQQNAIQPGDAPKQPLAGQPAQIRLVRLTNDTQQLAVVSLFAGNQYALLDTLTLAKVEGQLVSAITDEESVKTFFTANGYFRGNLPYQPYRFAFEYLWTPAQYHSSLGELVSPVPEVTTHVYDLLERIHTSVTLWKGQGAALELLEAVNNYLEAGGDNPPYAETLAEAAMQVREAFFPKGIELLQESLLSVLPAVGAPAAAYMYEAGIEEMAGENTELTSTLLRYARRDNIIPLHSGGLKGYHPESLPYPPLYVVKNLSDFNALSTRYFDQEPYKALGVTDNQSVLTIALNQTRHRGLLDSCIIHNNKLCIGCSYEELVHTISDASCNENTSYYSYPLTLLRMLQELSGNAEDPQAGLIAKYAVPDYYRFITGRRLQTMREVYHLTENFDFSAWDAAYGESFGQGFEPQQGETSQQTTQRQIGQLLAGKGCALPANADGVNFFLDHMQAFTAAGVTCVGITSVYGDIIEKDLHMYFNEYAISNRLTAMLMTLDKGVAEGPFRRLFEAVRAGHLTFVAPGQADGSVMESENGFTHLYFRGGTMLNALRNLEGKGKFVIFTHQYMMFSTPGLNAPLPGLTQCLHIPGAWVDDSGLLHHYADSPGRSVLIEAGESREVDGQVLPVANDDDDDPVDNLAHLMPEEGKFLGFKTFTLHDVEIPTVAGREALLKKTVSEADWPALKQDVDTIKDALKDLITQEATSGSTQGFETNRRLEIQGYQPGNGVTLTWWCYSDDKLYWPYHHTAPTVLIRGNEYVVDPTHLQFIFLQDEGVIMLPVDDWANEICARAMASIPYLVYDMKTDSELTNYAPLIFAVPRLPK